MNLTILINLSYIASLLKSFWGLHTCKPKPAVCNKSNELYLKIYMKTTYTKKLYLKLWGFFQ